ncbi:MAG: hypothetical protein IPG12_04925 [Saprospiraceae bacterium]|nr:hypothetical protein [Saprospiraceae bacterium]
MEFYENYDKNDKAFRYYYNYEYSDTYELIVVKKYEYDEDLKEHLKLNPDFTFGNYVLIEKLNIRVDSNKNPSNIDYLFNINNDINSSTNVHLLSYPKIYGYDEYLDAVNEIKTYSLVNPSDLGVKIVSKERRISIGIDKYKSEIIKEYYEL